MFFFSSTFSGWKCFLNLLKTVTTFRHQLDIIIYTLWGCISERSCTMPWSVDITIIIFHSLFEISSRCLFIFQPLIFILSNSRLGDVPLFVYRRSNFRLWVAGIRYNHDRVLISTSVVESCLTRGVVGFCVIRKLPITLWLTSWFVLFDVTFTPYPSKLFYLGAHALNLVIILSERM